MLAEPRASPPAVVIASLLPLRATVAAASASIVIDTSYPFGDGGTVRVNAAKPTTLKVRIPGWAVSATVNGQRVANGTFASVACAPGNTSVAVAFKPEVRIERGWGDTLATPPADAVAVVRGPLLFALHPRELRTVVTTYNTTPAAVGHHAPDYLIRTDEPWNYALDLSKGATFVSEPSADWSLAFPFDDSGAYPFAVRVSARRVAVVGLLARLQHHEPAARVARRRQGPGAADRAAPHAVWLDEHSDQRVPARLASRVFLRSQLSVHT